MDIYQTLIKDHNELRPLLDRLVKASENDTGTKNLLDQIRDLLVPHSRAEEAVFYNSLRAIETTKDLVAQSFKEHAEAEALLRTLRGLEKINIEWTKAAEKLRDAVNEHIREEEGRVFEAAKQVLFKEEAQSMARAFERLKSEARQQSDLKNTMDMIANMMPKRFQERTRSFDASRV